ncbi:serine aminopeptidase S33 family [Anseongella ginsenosidimutans]|uniref:Serine aminopeptidase S33 family n=1 Tax=Anseongella ginsenosidimutans TaxID=496056 RepID=A0A4R3KL28_9SPHI|nr:alpha/beta fold hydrolase [Anseongella ginsenosidimutans]QEC53571.1 alpha/beta fold hydrolase [Anseongella ginsenosidimutans]TCS84641.1 serine aminopeptidase S33 family [Anseongella ginsenosidimutans]
MDNFAVFRLLSLIYLLGSGLSGRSQTIDYQSYSRELTIAVNDSTNISGTIIRPAQSPDRNRLIILVSPPKRYDRDMSANKLKYFHYLANEFVQRGYSVFRFDNRGIGKSSGSNKTLTLYSHAADVKGICYFFLNSKAFSGMEIGLLGISEGGSSAIVAASEIPRVSCLLLLSTPANFGWEGFNYQMKKHFESRGAMFGLQEFADSMLITATKHGPIVHLRGE